VLGIGCWVIGIGCWVLGMDEMILTFGSGILSAFFLNDTLALVFTPLTLTLTQRLKLHPIPYLNPSS
jgi:hypothetical protein